MKWLSLSLLLAPLACGAGTEVERAEGANSPEAAHGESRAVATGEHTAERREPVASADGDSAALASSPPTAEESPSESGEPDTPEEVVAALIRAMQSGNRERAEALHYRDAKRWSDQAGFEKRVEYYPAASISTSTPGELHEGWIEENLGGNQPRR